MAQRAPARAQASAPAETLSSLNLGVNQYTDPTITNPRQWMLGNNAYSGAFGNVARARFANVLTPGATTVANISTSFGSIAPSFVGNNLVATVTTLAAHGFTTGQFVTLAGTSVSSGFGYPVTFYNGTYQITSTPTTTTFVITVLTYLADPPPGNSGTATVSVNNYLVQGTPITTFKYFALPGLSTYLLFDTNGKLYSCDTANSYIVTPRINTMIDPQGLGNAQLNGPWMREVLNNIVYECNGQQNQAGRLANAATIENWGLSAPDVSPQVVITAGTTENISSITRLNGTVTAVLAGALTVPGGNGIGFINVVGETNDPTFNGTFVVLTGSGTTTLTWAQQGQNTTPTAAGTVNTQITKSVGRSYAWAWENANKSNVSAPSPVTQYIQYTAQNGIIQLIEQGTISFAVGTATVTGIGTAFTSAWVGRSLCAASNVAGINENNYGPILSVQSATQLTLLYPAPNNNGTQVFQIFDTQATHIRLYETADGGATYFRCQRNVFNPNIANWGLQFFDNGNSEPPNFPFTTETSQLYNVPPPVGAFIKEYQSRLLLFGGTIPGQTFFYTNIESTTIGLPQENCAPLNQITLPIQNANISGMADLPGDLIIWSDKQDMFRLTGLLADNTPLGLGTVNTSAGNGTAITALPYNVGCANPFAVCLTP